jgi:hypothetical protein
MMNDEFLQLIDNQWSVIIINRVYFHRITYE